MTVWFISRDPGACEWAREEGLVVDRWCEHLDLALVGASDIVIGTLPVPMAAEVCRRGASYWHLVLELPYGLRGRELDSHTLRKLDARLERYVVAGPDGCVG